MRINVSRIVDVKYDRSRVIALSQPEAGRRGEWLGNFMMGDLQRNAGYVVQLIETIDNLENGIETDEIFGGNGMQLTLTRNGAELEHLIFDDQPNEHYTLAEIRAAVEDWLEVIRQHKNSRTGG